MDTLYEWVEEHNRNLDFVYPFELTRVHNDRYKAVVLRLAAGHKKQYYKSGMGSHVLRPSMLGKPAAYVATLHFLRKLAKKTPSLVKAIDKPGGGRTKLLMWLGDMFEGWAMEQFKRLGYTLDKKSKFNIQGNGYSLPGNIDFHMWHEEYGEAPFVIDTKLTNSKYFNWIVKCGLDDDRGYITQLSIYQKAFGVERIGLLFGDRETGRLYLIEPDENDLELSYNRAIKVCESISKCETFNDIYKYITPPPPLKEIFRGSQTGRFILPYQMASVKDFFYKTESGVNGYGKDRTYVTGYNYPDNMKEYEPELS